MDKPTVKDVIKSGNVTFEYFRRDKLYYMAVVGDTKYIFPVPVKDVDDTSLFPTMKAIHLMKWITKAIESENFAFYGKVA